MIRIGLLSMGVLLAGCTSGVYRPPTRASLPSPDDRGDWSLVGPSEAMNAEAAVLSEYNAEFGRRDATLQAGKWDSPVRAAMYDVDNQPSLADVRRLWLPCDSRTIIYFDDRGGSRRRSCDWDPGCSWVR